MKSDGHSPNQESVKTSKVQRSRTGSYSDLNAEAKNTKKYGVIWNKPHPQVKHTRSKSSVLDTKRKSSEASPCNQDYEMMWVAESVNPRNKNEREVKRRLKHSISERLAIYLF